MPLVLSANNGMLCPAYRPTERNQVDRRCYGFSITAASGVAT
jgi:hypothetical protein